MSSASSCDVLVVGAGPAGSAAAHTLAAAGYHVVIADQRAFPRDKVCGDGLISDALSALAGLGVDAAVRREAWQGRELRVYAPGGAHVSLRGEFACLPRERLDAILLEASRAAGAVFLNGTAVSPLIEDDRVVGARFKTHQREVDVRARVTVLATGANATTLDAFGLRVSKKPDSVAGRAYYQASPDVATDLDHLSIVYNREWCPGYGWIFPGPGGRFNIGVGLFAEGAAHGRLHQFFEVFCRTFPPAIRLLRASTLVREFRGAPIRSGLNQPSFGRPGLLAVGEAVATTYAATGEGIGKAMESALLAGELIAAALRQKQNPVGLEHAYRRSFQGRFLGRYRAYGVAQRWAASPLMLNLLARRANRGSFVQGELEALVAERGNAAALFSGAGLLKALFR